MANDFKPLEPGCLALVVGGVKWAGRSCTCVERIPAGTIVRVTTPHPARMVTEEAAWIVDFPDMKNCGVYERQLRRIDGHKPEFQDFVITKEEGHHLKV